MSLHPNHQKKCTLSLYCTEKDNPIVVDESCQLVGILAISVPEHFTGIWSSHENYEFGMTEIKVSATVNATNETFETTLGLLE